MKKTYYLSPGEASAYYVALGTAVAGNVAVIASVIYFIWRRR